MYGEFGLHDLVLVFHGIAPRTIADRFPSLADPNFRRTVVLVAARVDVAGAGVDASSPEPSDGSTLTARPG
jgi:hypothetical protein